MQSVMERPDMDYRLIYLVEHEFDMRMSDIYLARAANAGAPFFDEILNELWDMMASVYIKTIKGTPAFDTVDWRTIQVIKETGDPEIAIPFFLEVVGERFCQLFQRDVYLYLLEHQFNFFMRDFRDRGNRPRLINPTIVPVW